MGFVLFKSKLYYTRTQFNYTISKLADDNILLEITGSTKYFDKVQINR